MYLPSLSCFCDCRRQTPAHRLGERIHDAWEVAGGLGRVETAIACKLLATKFIVPKLRETGKKIAHCGDRTHDLPIKSRLLYQRSSTGYSVLDVDQND